MLNHFCMGGVTTALYFFKEKKMLITDNDTDNLKNALKKIDELEKENIKLKRTVNLYSNELKRYQEQDTFKNSNIGEINDRR